MPHVHRELDHELVRAEGHGQNAHYRIFWGEVRWDNAERPELAVVIFMQYGNTEDWELAKSHQEVNFMKPAHILEGDAPQVIGAMVEILRRNGGARGR